MNIISNPVNMVPAGLELKGAGGEKGTPEQSFGQFLQDAVKEVNSLQQQSQETKTQLLTGNVEDLHQVLIAGEKANVALQLTVQIRNKIVEAYQDIMRMQV